MNLFKQTYMELKTLSEMRAESARIGSPRSMTLLDRQREALSLAIAKRMHRYIKPHPHAIDIDDIVIEREGWITEEELKAATSIVYEHFHSVELEECQAEALKRNVV